MITENVLLKIKAPKTKGHYNKSQAISVAKKREFFMCPGTEYTCAQC